MIETPEGFEQAGSKFKFNSLEFEFNSPVKIVTNSGKEIEWINPGFMVEGLIFGKRSAGYSGPFKISDKSGYKFEGKIVKPFKIVGQIIGPDGNVIDTVDGDITKQVLLKSKKQEWFKVIEFEKLETKVPKTALDDPLYTGNVWKEVFVHMRQTPPDFKEADREKGIVEEAQRVRAKENPEKVQSQFGFTCKTIH